LLLGELRDGQIDDIPEVRFGCRNEADLF